MRSWATMENRWRVHKFGGSSVADASCMRRVADILKREPAGRLGIVLSACRGVTDDLLNLVGLAERQEPFSPQLDRIRERHHQIAAELCSANEAKAYGE